MRCFYTTPPLSNYPASGSPVSIPPVDPAQYPARAARQWIPRVSRQSGLPVDPAEYPARAARQWIPPSIPPASESRVARQWIPPSSWPVDPAEYPTRAARQWIPPSIPLARQWFPPSILVRIVCRWILPSIRPVSSRSGSPVFASGSRQYPARAARQPGFA